MRKSTKHQNQQTVSFSSFEGGLNTCTSEENIAQTQLSECVNMEANPVTKQLMTSKGTYDLLKLAGAEDIKSAAWDNINEYILVFTKDNKIYVTDVECKSFEYIGDLNGDEYVITANWEDGVLIASGDKLQYAKVITDADVQGVETTDDDGNTTYEHAHADMADNVGKYSVYTIEDSPDKCRFVFVRSGRVCVFGYAEGDNTEDYVHYSSVGDEETWETDSNDPSMAVFAQIGYKVGGKLLAACNLLTDVLFVKDNGMCYRLENEYPDWVIKEVGRNVYCMSPHCICANAGNSVMMLGANVLSNLTTTEEYGDVRPAVIGQQVADQIAYLPKCTKMRYLPALNQIWFVSEEQYVLVYDCNLQAFFQRYFNSDVVDVMNVVNDIVIVKKDRLCLLDNNTSKCEDAGKPLQIRARFKSEATISDFLVKGCYLSVTPLQQFYDKPNVIISVGKINLSIPQRTASTDGFRKQTVGVTQKAIEPESPFISDTSADDVVFSPENLAVGKSVLLKTKQMFRGERIRLFINGEGFPFTLNYLAYDRVEV